MPEPVVHRQIQFRMPPGAVELILVRHGESEAAIEGEPFEGTTCPGGCPEKDWDAERDRLDEMSLEDRYGD